MCTTSHEVHLRLLADTAFQALMAQDMTHTKAALNLAKELENAVRQVLKDLRGSFRDVFRLLF